MVRRSRGNVAKTLTTKRRLLAEASIRLILQRQPPRSYTTPWDTTQLGRVPGRGVRAVGK